MPAALIPAIGAGVGAAGKGASAAGGKKAQNQASQLASQQLGLEKGMFSQGQSLIAPASSYWNNLLKGGQAAVQATGPYASLLGQQGEGTRQSILAQTPRGGEQNLALAQNSMQTGNNISRLYAGMQPAAAGALGQLGGLFTGAGQSLAFPASMSGMGAAQMGLANAQGGAQGFGSLLYNSLNKLQNRGGGGQGLGMTLSNLLTGAGGGPPVTTSNIPFQIG